MRSLTNRGLKIYFRDKSGLFFSLLGVLIIFGLFIFFLGDSMLEDFRKEASLLTTKKAEEVMNNWVVAGMLASASITTSMGAYALMVIDKDQKLYKDFYTSPVKRFEITGGYLLTGFIISVIMSVIVLVIGEAYILIKGGELIEWLPALKMLGYILLSSFASSALVCFLLSFIRSTSAYTTLSIILGTLIGFLVGCYIPIGNFVSEGTPGPVYWVMACFPGTHSASLFRQTMMEQCCAELPSAVRTAQFKELGVTLRFGDYVVEPWLSMTILAGTGILFYILAILNMNRKAKK